MLKISENKIAKIKSIFLNKYMIVLLFFAVVIVFFDDSNLILRFRTARKIDNLEIEINKCKNDIKTNKLKIRELEAGGENVEKFAREQYFFKKDNEDIFIIEKKEK